MLMQKFARLWSLPAAGLWLYFTYPAHQVMAAVQVLNLDPVSDPQVPPMPSMTSLFFRLLVSLIIIVGLTYLTMKLLRKNMKVLTKAASINVLDQYAFSINKGIYITQIAGKVYVLGVTDHNISLITEITDEAEIEEISARARERDAEPIIPSSILKRIIPGFSSPNVSHGSFNSHIQKQIEKLQKIVDNRGGYSREDDKDE